MSRFLTVYTNTDWTVLALLIFFIFFLTLFVRIFAFKDSKSIEQGKWIIFQNGENHE